MYCFPVVLTPSDGPCYYNENESNGIIWKLTDLNVELQRHQDVDVVDRKLRFMRVPVCKAGRKCTSDITIRITVTGEANVHTTLPITYCTNCSIPIQGTGSKRNEDRHIYTLY